MSGLTIRNLDPAVKADLRLQAARHASSMEEEARKILRAAIIKPPEEKGLGSFIQQKFTQAGGVELTPHRSAPRNLDFFEEVQ
ncbi:MAG: plasmid stabilization protein [Candidatus Electrothrix sp. AX2]|nr:plasmid stabilization protein [Candidatus Electrothrix gigas]